MRYEIRNAGILPGVIPSPVKRFLQLDGTGTHEIIADYSETPGSFQIGPPEGQVWSIARLLIYIEGVGQFAAAKYGPLAALTNGLEVRVRRPGVCVCTLTNSAPFKSTADISRHCYDVAHYAWGVGADACAARWTFARGGAPIVLEGEYGDILEVVAQDDFTGLDSHTMKADGVILLGPDDWDEA